MKNKRMRIVLKLKRKQTITLAVQSKLAKHTVESEVQEFLAGSNSLKCCSTNRPWVPVFIGVNRPITTLTFGALQTLPVYFPLFISGTRRCWLARCIPAFALVLDHHPVGSYFDRAHLRGTWTWNTDRELCYSSHILT